MVRYLIMDVDGTLTDGKIYMGNDGEIMKAFSVKDGYAINFILKPADIIPIIITARTSSIVQRRCKELGIEKVYQGKQDKAAVLKRIFSDENLSACAYFGDDIPDLECMLLIKESGGIVGCPFDAVREIKAVADYVCMNKAGEGALREFSEWLVAARWDEQEIHHGPQEATEYLLKLEITEADTGKRVIKIGGKVTME